MNYINAISLEEAKAHLGVDDTSRDREIERMIDAACSYVEKHSNHIFYPRDKKYFFRSGCIRVYDFPINSVTLPADTSSITTVEEQNSTLYANTNTEDSSITLNVGYNDSGSIPVNLIEAAYMVLEHLYNQKETGGSTMPITVIEMIRSEARHVI